jgi:hypothetical protein
MTMKIENTEVYGFSAAFRGMRNPFDSWDKADSHFWYKGGNESSNSQEFGRIWYRECPQLGDNDLALACKLIGQGGDHRKFLRMIVVWVDFVFPRFVWQEVDTYKIATVRNSCSTMNTLGRRDLTDDDFERPLPEAMLVALNEAIADFRESKGDPDKDTPELRVMMKSLLPEGMLQRATYMMNYEVAFRMFFSRRDHRLPMWRATSNGSICHWIKCMPYMTAFLDAWS